MNLKVSILKKMLHWWGLLEEVEVIQEEPLVSIILPSYNYAQYIGQAMDSVFNQTYTNWELIIIDDASTDNSLNIVNKKILREKQGSRVILIKNKKNLGLINSYKKALSKAKGKYVAFIDADDLWQKDNLMLKVSVFEQFPKLSIVYSRCDCFVDKFKEKSFSNKIPVLISENNNGFIFRMKILSFSLVLTKRELLNKVRFDLPKKYFILCDWWVYFQLLQKGSLAKIPFELVSKRIHSKSYSTKFFSKNDQEKVFSEFREFLRRKFLKMDKFLFKLVVLGHSLNWQIRKIILKFLKSDIF